MRDRRVIRGTIGKPEHGLQMWRLWRTRVFVAVLFVLVEQWSRGRVGRPPRRSHLCRLRGLAKTSVYELLSSKQHSVQSQLEGGMGTRLCGEERRNSLNVGWSAKALLVL